MCKKAYYKKLECLKKKKKHNIQGLHSDVRGHCPLQTPPRILVMAIQRTESIGNDWQHGCTEAQSFVICKKMMVQGFTNRNSPSRV